MLIEKRQKKLHASHTQFYVEDVDNPGDTGAPEFWTREALSNQLAVVPGTIGIGTGSYGDVLVIMEAHDSAPQFDSSQWDHATEAGLEITKGKLQIVGCLDAGNEEVFDLKPGQYRVRCCHANLEESTEFGEGGDWYSVQFWPSEPRISEVLKFWRGKA